MTPQELKSSILQLAVQGKLVEQRPEEGTAEELYRQIQEEKQRLIKEGKIKKEKTLPEITEDEVPFDIPESWKWVRWGNIVHIVSARRVHQSDWKSEGIPFYRAREIAKLSDCGFVKNELYISPELFNEYSKNGLPKAGDLMVTAVGTLGKTYIVRENDCFYYKDASVICLENFGKINSKYLKYLLSSEMTVKQIKNNSSGTTVATLTIVRMSNYIIPLPPLAEQKRIVARIEELLPYIDRYEKAWSKLEDFNKRFPHDMQKSVLQMAIQGKLVEQRPEEGTGEELYRQIQTEKQSLIKSGKIKKEKPLPEITEDEIPFDIPEGWKWVRLIDVIDVRDGTHGTPGYLPSGYPLITGKDFYTGVFCLDKTQYISEVDYKEIIQRSKVEIDDILFSMIGGNIGSMIMITKDNYFEMAIKNVALFKQYNYTISLADYLFVFLKSQVPIFQAIAKGGAQSFVPLNMLRKYLFPLPPLAEQKRIVQKLEEILPLCKKLK